VTLASVAWALFLANVRATLQYRLNVVIWFVVGIAFQLTSFFFLWALLARFRAVGGWTLEEIAFLYGIRLVGHGLTVFVFGGFQIVEWNVREGYFDRYLTWPVPPVLTVLTWWRPSSAGDLFGGLVLLAAAIRIAPVDLSPIGALYLVLAIAGAALVEAAFRFAFAALSFRFLRTSGLMFFVDTVFNTFGNLPLRIFGLGAEAALTFAIPVAFIAYFPASVLLGRTSELAVPPAIAYGAPLAGAVLFGLAYLLWRHELPRYQSSGS